MSQIRDRRKGGQQSNVFTSSRIIKNTISRPKSGLQEGASAGQKQSRDHQAVLYTNTVWQRFGGTAIFIVEKQYSKSSYWEQTKV